MPNNDGETFEHWARDTEQRTEFARRQLIGYQKRYASALSSVSFVIVSSVMVLLPGVNRAINTSFSVKDVFIGLAGSAIIAAMLQIGASRFAERRVRGSFQRYERLHVFGISGDTATKRRAGRHARRRSR